MLLERHGSTEVGAQTAVGVVVDLRPRRPVLEDLAERTGTKQKKRKREHAKERGGKKDTKYGKKKEEGGRREGEKET